MCQASISKLYEMVSAVSGVAKEKVSALSSFLSWMMIYPIF